MIFITKYETLISYLALLYLSYLVIFINRHGLKNIKLNTFLAGQIFDIGLGDKKPLTGISVKLICNLQIRVVNIKL